MDHIDTGTPDSGTPGSPHLDAPLAGVEQIRSQLADAPPSPADPVPAATGPSTNRKPWMS